ncbi:MAG: UDP-N-acetylmuramoyl-tripeptide--D-alanyl-D-alanine ligase [Planctomycetes bacterium]|nr:UDP-N-acetylmuramoyl-tripeptide--D-alanyl-D-alanine ligase [Planctomycetota bacterium]
MIKLTLSEMVEALRGQVSGDVPACSVQRVTTDSRAVLCGDLFLAIAGERFDGHDFVAEALASGAVAAVIASSKTPAVRGTVAARADGPPPGVLIEVDDTVAALGRLAAYHRRLLAAHVIAVVGSNGKTTVKAMIEHILRARLRGSCSPKSFNNRIGVPLTLLSADASDEYLVVEIGTNSLGEIAELGALVEPTMAVMTSVGEEHLEGLCDLEGVAEEECSILDGLRSGGFAAVNVDSPQVRDRLRENGVTIATFGWHSEADLRVSEAEYAPPWLRFLLNGRFAYRLRLAGVHNAINAAGAITIARRLGFSDEEIAGRLESFAPPPMRNEVLRLAGVTLINDAYNANPPSALAAFESLRAMPCSGRRIAVVGEMCELGERSDELHRKIADGLALSGVDRVLLVGGAGDLMHDALAASGLFGPRVERCAGVENCVERLSDELREGDVVLLKASRAVGLDRVIEPLKQRLAATPVV